MSHEIETNRLDWTSVYLQYIAQQENRSASKEMAAAMRGQDSFLPEALGQFEEGDLEKLLVLRRKLGEEAYRINYYVYYLRVVEKLIVMVAEQYHEKFELISNADKENLFGIKASLPDESALYKVVYIYLLGRRQLGPGMFPTGMSLRNVLERLQKEAPDALDERLIALIASAHDEYQRYFLKKYQDEQTAK